MNLAQALLTWYDVNGRELPWRENPTPYTILVSEIMLQQTRVEAVLPLYERFLKRFPTIKSLAAASQDEVLTYWQGLGYYSRARRLHQAAQIITSEYNGCIPDKQELLLALPGIGDYTCGAIMSMAFSHPAMAIDGNLLRIGARLFLVHDPINRARAKHQIQSKFQQLIPRKRPGDFNQALMDLGSSICLPKNPRCNKCPISVHCQALLQDRVSELPTRDAPKPPQQVKVQLYLVQSKESILLRKRDSGGFLQGMWELPWFEVEPALGVMGVKVAEENVLPNLLEEHNLMEIKRMEYVFSHRHWLMTIFHYQVREEFYTPSQSDTHYLWQPLITIDEIALPTVFKRALKVLLEL